MNTFRARVLITAITLVFLVDVSFLVSPPPAFGCTFAALKSVILATDPPRPVKGKPFALTATLRFGGGMGHGNMLTAAENAISATLTLPEGTSLIEGTKTRQTTTHVFGLGYETTFPLAWKATAEKPGRQRIGIQVENTTLGQGQQSSVSTGETGLLGWEVVRPSMKDVRIEAGDKDEIAETSLSLMPSLRLKGWQVLPNNDVLFTDADGTRYSVAAGELALGKDDPSPVIATDANGNQYLASNGYVVVGDGPEVFAPTVRPSPPGPSDTITVQAKIVGAMEQGKAALLYSTDGRAWRQVGLRQTPGDNLWKGEIPAQGRDGLTINYYLQATDSANRTVTLPRYSVRVVDPSRLGEGVRNVALLTLAHLVVALGGLVLWAWWDLSRKTKRARKGRKRILVGDQRPLHPQGITDVIAQLRRPVSARVGLWWIGFGLLVFLGLLFTLVGILTNQFQIINLIIRMG